MHNTKSILGLDTAAVVTIISKITNIVYRGSNYIDSYVDKTKRINYKNKIELETDGFYSITKADDKPFKILQLTDLHIGGGYLSRHEDMKALAIAKAAIYKTKPDLIVLTGDLACPRAHLSLSRNNLNSYRILTNFLENTGIPYAITFGNHDTEGKAMFERRGLTDYLISRKNSLFTVTKETRAITGYSNYYVKLRNKDGELNSVIYIIDSNEYISKHGRKSYDYIHEDQVQWYQESVEKIAKENGRNVPSHMFFHIPIREYKDAWNSAVNAEEGSKYFYGSRDESISPSKEESKMFETILKLQSTKAIYCGHDHLNDFSVEYKGIRFTYGQSIDCILYSKNLLEHKGATLIKIKKDGTFEIKPKKCR